MVNDMNPGNDTGILLDSGTNEIEIMEFTIDGDAFGINVAKVKEIMTNSAVKPMPNAHPAVDGVFKPRDTLLTVINLPNYLGLQGVEKDRSLFIVTSFNHMNVAFRVDMVIGINRISWKNIEKPDRTIYGGTDGVATGIADCNDHLITILDFEKIVADISPDTSIKISDVTDLGARLDDNHPIVVVEDSMLLAKMILECLHTAGFNNVKKFDNGEEAWEYLSGLPKTGDPLKTVSCIITDIEMPKMDGHRLTKLCKDDTYLQSIPLIIFSSLIDAQMRKKGESLGANAQLSKPDIGHLVETIDSLVKGARN